MRIITSCSAPPCLMQLDPLMLSKPMSKWRDDSETINEIYQYIRHKLLLRHGCIKKRIKYEKLREKYKELYERIKEKEKELKEKGSHHTQGPLYFFKNPDCSYGRLFPRLKFARNKTNKHNRCYL